MGSKDPNIWPSPGAAKLADLVEEHGSQKKAADSIGLNVATFSRLMSGNLKAPGPRDTAILEAAGIPPGEWKWYASPEAPALDGDDLDLSPPAYLRTVRAWRKSLQSKATSPRDITAALDCERRAVELVRKAQEENAPEIIGLIREALAPWPDAREAVAKALRDAGYG
jgi:hypothetical protein